MWNVDTQENVSNCDIKFMANHEEITTDDFGITHYKNSFCLGKVTKIEK